MNLREPEEGTDVVDGVPFVSDRHKVLTHTIEVDAESVNFLSSGGETVARSPLSNVDTLSGPDGRDLIVNQIPPEKSKGSKNKKSGMQGKSWSAEEDHLLKEEYEEGLSISQIAENHERTKNAIEMRLLRLGLK